MNSTLVVLLCSVAHPSIMGSVLIFVTVSYVSMPYNICNMPLVDIWEQLVENHNIIV